MDKSKLGPFLLEDRLGEDHAKSTVFLALHLTQRKLVALKVFSAPLIANSPAAKAALVREMEVLKKLNHPHIVRCYGGLLEESYGCIAWELIDGESLSTLLSRRGRLAWESVVEFAAQLSQALEHAHDAGLIHQDLTPDKILVAPNDQLKVADFRCDRATNVACASSQRMTLNRAKYLSPEQLRGETKLTPQSDLYMLGCVMFHMLLGRPPFEADTIEELGRQRQNSRPPRIDSLVLDCPVWLDSLIGQLLELDPQRRPYGASAVASALAETQRKMAAKTSVLEHAAGGFSTLQRTADQSVARDLLRKARREVNDQRRTQEERPNFWERPWFLVACLLFLVTGVAAWLSWPRSESWYFAHAKALMESQNSYEWQQAREQYLLPMLEKYPKGEHREAAQEYVDQVDMAQAESGLRRRTRLGWKPKSEGERLFAVAWNYEQFGDRITALEQYESMIKLLSDNGPDRPYVQLARRQKRLIEEAGRPMDSVAFVQERLKYADELEKKGASIEARGIWSGIIEIYENNREFEALVGQARDRLGQKDPLPEKQPEGTSPKSEADSRQSKPNSTAEAQTSRRS